MMFRMNRNRPAFTLVEILLAFALLLGFCLGVFGILQHFSRMGSVGQWRSTTTGQVRKAQERIRSQIEAGAYPMLITPQANLLSDIPAHYLIVNPDGSGAPADTADSLARVFGPGTNASPPDEGDVTVLQVVKSRPGRQGLGNTGVLADRGVEASRIKLVLRGKTQAYGKTVKWNQTLFMVEERNSVAPGSFTTPAEFAFAGGATSETLLINDVNEVKVLVDKTDLGGGSASPKPVPVEVQIKCVDPLIGDATVETAVRAQPSSGVEVK